MSHPRTATAAAVLVALAVAGCSTPAANVPGSSASGAASASATPSPPASPGAGTGDPVTTTPIATQRPVPYPDTADAAASAQPRRNEVGGLWTLDAAGSRACSFTEFAFRAPETGGDATAALAGARSSIVTSANAHLVSAIAALPQQPSAAALAGVLRVCASLGYQL